MKLKDDFFQIKQFCKTEKGGDFTIAFNPEHFIYQAHFPNNPTTPGVCIIQIIKELLNEIVQDDLFLKKVNNVKFLNVINPLENNEVICSLSISLQEDNSYKIDTSVRNENQQFAKLSLLFLS